MIEKRQPQAGDVVRLTANWNEAKPGDFGIIDGMIGADMSETTGRITFRANAFRDALVVSVSGGPGTISGIPTRNLCWTGETVEQRFWNWKDGFPGAQRATTYYMEVPIWEWDGVQIDRHLANYAPEMLHLLRVAREAFAAQVDPEHSAHGAINWGALLNDCVSLLNVIGLDDESEPSIPCVSDDLRRESELLKRWIRSELILRNQERFRGATWARAYKEQQALNDDMWHAVFGDAQSLEEWVIEDAKQQAGE